MDPSATSATKSGTRELHWQALVELLRRAMPDESFAAAWSGAQQWQIDDAVRRALSPRAEPATV